MLATSTPTPSCSLGDGVAQVSSSGVLSASSGGVRAVSTTMVAPPSGAMYRFSVLHVDVNQSSPVGCTIARYYTEGVSSLEQLAYDAANKNIRWELVARSTKDRRLPAHVVTSVNVSWSATSNTGPAWWAPLERPIDPLNASDPLGLLRKLTGAYDYGGKIFAANAWTPSDPSPYPTSGGGITLPLVSWIGGQRAPRVGTLDDASADDGSALALILDPDDSTTYMRMNVAPLPSGGATFSFDRRMLSVGGNASAVRLAGDWLVTSGCWRPALGWFVEKHASYMAPHPRVDLTPLDGPGAYAYLFSGQLRPPKSHFDQLGLRMNWDASFPWLYHGPWVPFNDPRYFPIVTESNAAGSWAWQNCDPAGHGAHQATTKPDYPSCVNMSYSLLRSWYADAAATTGATTLMYGTLEEYGMGMREPNAPLPECDAAQAQNYTARLICGANRLLRDRFPHAIVRDARRGGKPVTAAWTSYIVDPGDTAYAAFLEENAATIATEFGGSAAGVCLDRGDYIPMINRAADDGVTCTADGLTGRALLNSWKGTIGRVARALHSAPAKALALFVNPDMGHRVDMYRGVDGFFDEMADPMPGGFRTASGWLSSGGKVGIVWCHDPNAGYGNATQCGKIMTNGTDAVRHHFMQSHLLLGLYPSVPIKDNDHQIQPATRADLFYKRYGPLWSALSGKRWLTTAHAVSVVLPKDGVRANAFERRPFGSGQYAVAVAFAAGVEEGNVTIRVALPEMRRDDAFPATRTRPIAIRAVATLIDGVQVPCATSQSVAHPTRVDMVVPVGQGGCAVVAITVS